METTCKRFQTMRPVLYRELESTGETEGAKWEVVTVFSPTKEGEMGKIDKYKGRFLERV